MHTITGKTLIFTDIHFGVGGNSVSRLQICSDAVKTMLKFIKDNCVDNVIFLGDFFHERASINVQTMNVAYECLRLMSSNTKFYFILGNHDIFRKTRTDINSAKSFKSLRNVYIIDKPEEVQINGKKCLLAPWTTDTTIYEKDTFDMIFGHFDISNRYFQKSFVTENVVKAEVSDDLSALIDTNEYLSNEEGVESMKSEAEVGSFVNIVKKGGTIFAGHIHQHEEYTSNGRNMIFVGSPWQQNAGEVKSNDGFYSMDEDGTYEFHSLSKLPKHIVVKMSDIVNEGVDNFDFSILENNIVKKIYDVEVDRILDSKISQKISYNCPYDQITSEYNIPINNVQSKAITLDDIKKNEFEYIIDIVNTIKDKSLMESSFDSRKELIEQLRSVYNEVCEEEAN